LNILDLKSSFVKSLSGIYPIEEIHSFFHILSEKYLSLSRLDIVLDPGREISNPTLSLYKEAVERLEKHEPIQYIIGETEFFDLIFKVNPATLIPRPETEELVDWILSELRNRRFSSEKLNILDIGTGSGCIAIALAKNLANSEVIALDISSEALKVAMQNAKSNGVKVNFFEIDILQAESLSCHMGIENYDIIVSNPPYIRELEKRQMKPNVLEYEPATALFVKDIDPLLFYRKISQLSRNHLKPNGSLFFEINEELKNDMLELLKNEGFSQIKFKKDIYSKDRMVRAEI